MPRPFEVPNAKIANDIRVLGLRSQISHDEGVPSYNFSVDYDILDADGQSMSKHVGDATDELTVGEITQLTNIVNRLSSVARATLP